MTASKDHELVIRFLTLFNRLRDMVDDDPEGLTGLTANDKVMSDLCEELSLQHHFLNRRMHEHPSRFAHPVDPNFIRYWRDFEQRYAEPLAEVFLFSLGMSAEKLNASKRDVAESEGLWQRADEEASTKAGAIESAVDWAATDIEDHGGEYDAKFVETVETGIRAWNHLRAETGLNLRDVFRRRTLIPFVLIPRQVSRYHGEAERLSLLTHLRQAHDAFIFGSPFASIALMRSILEVVLRKHFLATGKTLEELIDNCADLPANVPRQALHRLRNFANKILHFDENAFLPKNIEREVVVMLGVVRRLIEGVPVRPSR